MGLDLGLELGSCSRGDSGYGDGGNSEVIRDLYDGVVDGGDRFSRLRAALSDKIECKVRIFHNKRVQDEELKEKEAKRAQEEAHLRDLITEELDCSFDLCKPDPHGDSLEYRCGVVDDCTGERCVKVWKFSQQSLHQLEQCKLGYLQHVAHVHGIRVHNNEGVDGIIINSWCHEVCTRCRGLKEICDRRHGEVRANCNKEWYPGCGRQWAVGDAPIASFLRMSK